MPITMSENTASSSSLLSVRNPSPLAAPPTSGATMSPSASASESTTEDDRKPSKHVDDPEDTTASSRTSSSSESRRRVKLGPNKCGAQSAFMSNQPHKAARADSVVPPPTSARWIFCIFMACMLSFGLSFELPVTQWRVVMGVVAAVCTIMGLLASGELIPLAKRHRLYGLLCVILFVIYLGVFVVLLFQSLDDVRVLLNSMDERIGDEVPEYSHVADCSLSPSNIAEKIDFFVFGHTVGWAFKALLLREHSSCFILSLSFEVVEFCLVFQLDNFQECWWDTIVMDVLLCNTAGIIIGMWIVEHVLKLPLFDWVVGPDEEINERDGMSVRHGFPGLGRWKLRIADGWIPYISFVSLAATVIVCEVNYFYLKHLLSIPPPHLVNVYRILLHGNFGVMAISDYHDYLKGKAPVFPFYAIMFLLSMAIELCVIVKFSRGMFPGSMPLHIQCFCIGFAALLGLIIPVLLFEWRKHQDTKRAKVAKN